MNKYSMREQVKNDFTSHDIDGQIKNCKTQNGVSEQFQHNKMCMS